MNGICACCDEPGRIIAFGWREACYFRWRRAGKPASGPPPRTRLRRHDRLEEYAFLRTGGETPAEASRRVGLTSDSSTRRYERAWKAVA